MPWHFFQKFQFATPGKSFEREGSLPSMNARNFDGKPQIFPLEKALVVVGCKRTEKGRRQKRRLEEKKVWAVRLS